MSRELWRCSVSLCCLWGLSAGTVFGQNPGSEGLEEIVVTARKRSESLHEVPGTIQAFAAADVERAGIRSMRDYVSLTPGMALVETQNQGFAFVSVRGLSQVRNSEPTVAVVIDGVQQTTSLGFSQELYDIQQIEVLKGPQGALYGRNSSGGAINITTRPPSERLEAFLRAGYGNGDHIVGSGSISGPLSGDTVRGRVAIAYADAGGWRENVTRRDKVDPYEDLSIRTRVIWEPSERFAADVRFSYSESEGNSSQFAVNSPNFLAPPAAGGGLPGAAATWQGRSNGTAAVLSGVPASLASLIGDPNNTSSAPQANLAGTDRREVKVASVKLDWETPAGTLMSITSLDELDLIGALDSFPYFPYLQSSSSSTAGTRSDAIVLPPAMFGALASINATIGQNRFHEGISQEIRFTSPDDQRLRWIAGAYYAATDVDVMISVNEDLGRGLVEQRTEPNIGGDNPTATWNSRFLATVAPVFAAAPSLIPASCQSGPTPPNVCAASLANPNLNPQALSYNYDRNENEAYAVFGQMEFDFTDAVELSLALRYDRDEREQTIAAKDRFLPAFSFRSGYAGEVREARYDSWQPKATLRWTPTEDVTVYGAYSEGFRSGGFNLSGVSAGVAALIAARVPGMPQGVEDSWRQEETQGFEVGLKVAEWLGWPVAFDVSAYQTRIDDAFAFTYVAPFSAQVIRNIAEAEVKGVELNASWRPVESVQIDLGYGVLDSKIKRSNWLGAGGVNIVGKKLPLNPDSTLNVGVTYSYSATSWESYLRADYQRLGKTPFEPENFVLRDPVDLVNVRAGVAWRNGIEITAWAKNLTDEDYTAEFTNPNGISWPAKLRQYGIELTKRF